MPISERDLDQQLVERFQSGDLVAFDLLVSKYQRKVLRLLSRMIRDADELEDVAQEAFIKAYRALPRFRGDSAFYTWLYRIAVNTAKNHLAAQSRRLPPQNPIVHDESDETFGESDGQSTIDSPDLVLQGKQVVAVVNKAMEALSDDLRMAITLREIDGLSYEEIAEIMDCPVGTVRSRIFRAREAIAERLRPLLDERGARRW